MTEETSIEEFFENYKKAENQNELEFEYLKDAREKLLEAVKGLKNLDEQSQKDLEDLMAEWTKALNDVDAFYKSELFSNVTDMSDSWNLKYLALFNLTEITDDEKTGIEESKIFNAFISALNDLSKYGNDKKSYLGEYIFLKGLIKRLKEIYTRVNTISSLRFNLKLNIPNEKSTDLFKTEIYSNLKVKIRDISNKEKLSIDEKHFIEFDDDEKRLYRKDSNLGIAQFNNKEQVELKALLSMMPDFFQSDFSFGFYKEIANNGGGRVGGGRVKDFFDNETGLNQKFFKIDKDNPTEPAEETGNNGQSLVEHLKNTYNSFCIRALSFDIPLPKAHTTQLNFLTRKIEKVTSGIEQAHTIEVKFEIDQNGYLINFFERMAGWNNAFPSTERLVEPNELQYLFTPGGFTKRNEKLNIFIKYNDIYGKAQFYGNNAICRSYRLTNTQNGFIPGFKKIKTQNECNGFILKDVQFLGFTNSIDFNRDSANNITLGAKFRFKQLYEIV